MPVLRFPAIDPPFERPDDYRRIEETLRKAASPQTSFLVWTPLKDLETFDAFLRSLDGRGLVLEARMRPLSDPMKMNGCALVLAPSDVELEPAFRAIGEWVVGALGQAGLAKVYLL